MISTATKNTSLVFATATAIVNGASQIKWIKPGRPSQDPFLMTGIHDDEMPAGKDLDATPGFPQHPHRGMETVTYVIDGVIDHADTMGGSGRFSNGDVQWMTAGSGLCHSEVSPMLHMDRPNRMELFQLWLNLPPKDKMCAPHTSMLWNEDISVHRPAEDVTVKVIASPLKELRGNGPQPNPNSWAADPKNGVQILHAKVGSGATYHFQRATGDSNLTIYVFKAEKGDREAALTISNDEAPAKVPVGSAVAFESSQGVAGSIPLSNEGAGELDLLILEGRPIGEPVSQRGPFVMNSEEEIMQAFHDYRFGDWSSWPWPVDGPMHGDVARFTDSGDGFKEARGDVIKTIDCGEASYMPEMKANGWKAPGRH